MADLLIINIFKFIANIILSIVLCALYPVYFVIFAIPACYKTYTMLRACNTACSPKYIFLQSFFSTIYYGFYTQIRLFLNIINVVTSVFVIDQSKNFQSIISNSHNLIMNGFYINLFLNCNKIYIGKNIIVIIDTSKDNFIIAIAKGNTYKLIISEDVFYSDIKNLIFNTLRHQHYTVHRALLNDQTLGNTEACGNTIASDATYIVEDIDCIVHFILNDYKDKRANISYENIQSYITNLVHPTTEFSWCVEANAFSAIERVNYSSLT